MTCKNCAAFRQALMQARLADALDIGVETLRKKFGLDKPEFVSAAPVEVVGEQAPEPFMVGAIEPETVAKMSKADKPKP
ncbi:MAG: hypothetical protein ABW128_15485 [Rhizorhabdus sp.]